MSRWFRFYDDAVNDPKVQMLPPKLFKLWVNLLCIASKNGGILPDSMDQLGFILHMKGDDVAVQLGELQEAGLFDDTEDEYVTPHNWNGRQFKSDTSADRVERYRDKRRASGLPTLGDYSKFRPDLIKRDGERCVYCLNDVKLVVDHMIPITLGGTDDEDNLALACKTCNAGKAGRTPELAGLLIRVTTAADALARYRDRAKLVTVTVTPPETEADTESETEQKEFRPKRVRATYPDDFEGFWKSYPRTPVMSKTEAWKAWQKLGEMDRSAAIEAVPRFVEWLKTQKDHPAVHVCRFLSQRRFDGFSATTQSSADELITIRVGDASWDAWRAYYRDREKLFAVKQMDAAAEANRRYAVPSLWPPGQHLQAAE